MLPKINPTTTKAWEDLQSHFSEMRSVHMRELFRKDPERFNKFSLSLDDILFDHSKNILSEKTIGLLLGLADACKLREAIEALYNGEPVNITEKRSVLHMALRNFSGNSFFAEGIDVMPAVKAVWSQIENFCTAVHEGKWR